MSNRTNQFKNNLPQARGREQTGFGENFNASLRTFMNEDNSMSRFWNQELYDQRNRMIDGMIATGEIPRSVVDKYIGEGATDYKAMSFDLKRQGYDVQDDYDVRDNTRASLRAQREEAQDIHNRAGLAGFAGMIGGGFAGAATDPINIGSMLIPGLTMVRGASLASHLAKSALYYSATGAAVETIIQPSVMSWKKEIRSEYTFGDAITNIALAGVAEGVLGTGVELGVFAVKGGFKSVKNNIRQTEPEHIADQQIQIIEQAEAEYDAGVRTDDLRELEETVNEVPDDVDLDAYKTEDMQAWLDSHEVEELHQSKAHDAVEDLAEEIEIVASSKGEYQPHKLSYNEDSVQLKAARAQGFDTESPWFRGAIKVKRLEGVTGTDGMDYAYFSRSSEFVNDWLEFGDFAEEFKDIPEMARPLENKEMVAKTFAPADMKVYEVEELLESGFVDWWRQRWPDGLNKRNRDLEYLLRGAIENDDVTGIHWEGQEDVTEFLNQIDPEWQAASLFEDTATTPEGRNSIVAKRGVLRSAWHDYAAKHSGPPVPEHLRHLDKKNRAAAARMDETNAAEEAKYLGEADDVVARRLAELDIDELEELTPEQLSARVDEVLGETPREEVDIAVAEVDGDGNVMYTTKSAADIDAEINDNIDMLDEFISCWTGSNG